MKKRSYSLLFASLFSLLLVAGCGGEGGGSSCDPMFGNCDSSSEIPNIVLEDEKATNYIYDDVSNENGSVGYEIFVRSFYDSDGDGIGDLNGISEKVSYLKELGVSNIWLMPIHPSPSYHGYDIDDYYAINPDYGTMEDFEHLVQVCDENNIDITIDLVLNHSSTRNQYFLDSFEDYYYGYDGEDSKADWYNWSDDSRGGYYSYNGVYFQGYASSMPDFNTQNPAVRQEFENIMKFWIEKGVKGFRLDAVLHYETNNTAYNSEFLTFLKEAAFKYDSDVFFVGEAWTGIGTINEYYKSKCDSFFKFNASLNGTGAETILGQVKSIRSATDFANAIQNQEATLKTNNPNGYSSYFLANHDNDRASNSFQGDDSKMAASLYLLLPGTPYMYYGEEIELKGKRSVDPDDNNDVKRRLPMVWSKTDKEGECAFPDQTRLDLADDIEQVEDGVYDQLDTNFSLLNHYRKVINVRNKYPFIKNSVFTSLVDELNTADEHVLAYALTLGEEEIVVVHNFNNYNVEVNTPKDGLEILDSISISHKVPELENDLLRLGAKSTIVLG